MSDRKTGATDAQIERAARRLYDAMPESDWRDDGFPKPVWDEENQPTRDAWITETRISLEYLVPPTARIVEDWQDGSIVFGPEDVAALRYVLGEAVSVKAPHRLEGWDEAIARLTALIGDDNGH